MQHKHEFAFKTKQRTINNNLISEEIDGLALKKNRLRYNCFSKTNTKKGTLKVCQNQTVEQYSNDNIPNQMPKPGIPLSISL